MLNEQEKADKASEVKHTGLDDDATQWDSFFRLRYIGGEPVKRPLFWALKESMLEEREIDKSETDPEEWKLYGRKHHRMIHKARTMRSLIGALNYYDDIFAIGIFINDAIHKVAESDELRWEETVDLVQAIEWNAPPK